MLYTLTNDFIKISENSGTIQNISSISTIEVSDNDVPNSGFLLFPLNKISFNEQNIFLRCVEQGELCCVRVVPFELDSKGGEGNVGTVILNGVSYHIASNSDILSLLNSTFDSEG